jgi:hypothetical protein
MGTSGEMAIAARAMPPRRPRFVSYHRGDRTFFLVFLIVCWLGVVMGFGPPVLQRLHGHPGSPAVLPIVMHATAFSSWLALLTVQTLLVRGKRIALHMKLGLVSVALVPFMAIATCAAEVYMQRWHLAHPPDNLPFLIFPIFWIVSFTLLASAAIALRRDPPAHKRLILIATTVIVGAAYDRWWSEALTHALGDGVGVLLVEEFLATNLIFAGAVAYDYFTRGRLHRIYETLIPLILLAEVAACYIYYLPSWPAAAALLISGA